jgi:hypothetical protein
MRTVALALAFSSSSIIQLSAQSDTPDVEQADRLHGTVVNAITHEPIGRALIVSPDNAFATMTDDRGHFEFKFLKPKEENTFGFSSGATPSQAAQPQVTVQNRPTALMARKTGYLAQNDAQELVQIGATQQEVIISLMPEARIVGHVVLRDPDVANNVVVQLLRRSFRDGGEKWDMAAQATTRRGGEFRIADLPAGSYKLFTLEHMDRDPLTFDPRGQSFGYPPVYYPSNSNFATAAVITLSPGETFQPVLSPVRKEYYPVKLALVNAPAESQVALEVWLQNRPGPGYELGYDPRENAIQGSLPDGNYTVKASSRGPVLTAGEVNITVRGAGVTGPALALLPAASIAVNVREEFQHAEISGLQNARPEVLSGNDAGDSSSVSARRPNYMQVNLVPEEEFGSSSLPVLRPSSGPDDESLVIQNALPGRYHVRVRTSIGFVSSITSGDVNLQRQPLVVGLGASPPPIEITMRDDGAEVDGQIENVAPKNNNPGIFASFQRTLGWIYFVPLDNPNGPSSTAWVGADGNFRMQQLPPGVYRVLAFDRQRSEFEFASEKVLAPYESKSRVIHVEPGQKEQLRLPLITAAE